MARELDLEVPRNGDYYKQWQLLTTTDDGAEVPVDLTGHTLVMEARSAAGVGGTAIASATLTMISAANGKFNVRWEGADFDAVDGVTEITRVAYDLKDTDGDGIIDIPIRGHLILFPEVTP